MNNTPNFLNGNVLRLLLAIFSAAAVFILSGCEFDYPVDSAPNAQIDENLIGEWKSQKYKTVKISKIDDGTPAFL